MESQSRKIDDREVPKRGRPITSNPRHIALVALHAFVDRGIENVTMDEIAELAGVSRPTVFRLFPTKAALVWGGMAEFTEHLEQELQFLTPGQDAVLALHAAWVRVMHSLDAAGEETRLRLKLIATNPEIASWGASLTSKSKQMLQDFLLQGSSSQEDRFRAEVVVTSLMAASQASLLWWAMHDDSRSPAEILNSGLVELERALGAR